jgi:hypothetical protein
MNARQHLGYVDEAIADMEYRKSRLEAELERIKVEIDTKKHARNEMAQFIENEEKLSR